jgi:hypothetical protein
MRSSAEKIGSEATKVCSRCDIEKNVTEFYVNAHYAGGYTRRCVACVKAAASEWATQNADRRRKVRLDWNARNKEQKRTSASALRQRKLSKLGAVFLEHDRIRVKLWRVNNPAAAAVVQARAYRKRCEEKPEIEKARRALARKRMLAHPIRSIAYRLSGTVRSAIKRQSVSKTDRTVDLIGCTVPEFMAHIAKQFQPGMSWDNWALDCWHLDHIRPISSFDLRDRDQQRVCFHYTNYQPLWARDNISKGAKDPITYAQSKGMLL